MAGLKGVINGLHPHYAPILEFLLLGRKTPAHGGRLYLPMSTRPGKEAVGPWGLAKALDASKSREGTCSWRATEALSLVSDRLCRMATVLIPIWWIRQGQCPKEEAPPKRGLGMCRLFQDELVLLTAVSRVVETVPNRSRSDDPIAVRAVIAATETSAAIRPYSIAVAPPSSRRMQSIVFSIFASLLHHVYPPTR